MISNLCVAECRALYKKIIDVLSKSSESRKKKMDRDSLQPITGMWTELQQENKYGPSLLHLINLIFNRLTIKFI